MADNNTDRNGKEDDKTEDQKEQQIDSKKSKGTAAKPDVEELRRLLNLQASMRPTLNRNAPKTEEELRSKQDWKFWETQPVPALGSVIPAGTNEPIHPNRTKDEIKADPFSLPDGFKWDDIELEDEKQLMELYNLLTENYVEDDDNMFRFDYSPSFLKWALMPPGWLKQWHAGVRVAKSGKLVGFISAVPAHMNVYAQSVQMVEINYLCVHKKLRAKRVAPVLIKEITRRVNMEGIFQAVYTAGVILPSPVSKCRYWHRSINPKKLIEVRFSHLARNMTMQRTIKLYRLPEAPKTTGFRKLQEADCPQAFKLLAENLTRFNLAPIFDLDGFKHWFLPRDSVIDSYVVEKDGVVTDFASFYHLPSTIMNHPQYNILKAAYLFYHVATKTPLVQLINDLLICARDLGIDVFNALDLMENKKILEDLKFGIGDGNLHYYIYNWKCPSLTEDKVGLVLQ